MRTKGRSSGKSVIDAVNASVERWPAVSVTVALSIPADVIVNDPVTSSPPGFVGASWASAVADGLLAVIFAAPPASGRLLFIQI